MFCCWKCGSGLHIGDKCREQARTFYDIFPEADNISEISVKPTCAAVVRSGNGETEEHKKRVQVMEQKLKEENQRRDRERFELEEKKRLDEREKKIKELNESRNVAVKKVALQLLLGMLL